MGNVISPDRTASEADDRRLLVGLIHRSRHHARASGYARLAEFIPSMETIDGATSRAPYRLRKIVGRSLPGRGMNYDSNSVSKELALLGRVLRNPSGVAHYFDAERDACLGPLVARSRSWRIAGSFHYPPAIQRTVIAARSIKHLDAAVALASNQAQFLSDLLGPRRVHLIPLGVDTDVFSPPSDIAERDRNHVLFVGQHLRDFAMFNEALESLRPRVADLRVTAVLIADYHHLIVKHPWVALRAGIDDDELISLYRRASCMMLPLRDAAGCTALLEAMSCGLPVVTTAVGGTADYVPDDCGARCAPGDSTLLADETERVITSDGTDRAQLEEAARRNALRFALPVVGAKLDALLRSIAD